MLWAPFQSLSRISVISSETQVVQIPWPAVSGEQLSWGQVQTSHISKLPAITILLYPTPTQWGEHTPCVSLSDCLCVCVCNNGETSKEAGSKFCILTTLKDGIS